MKGHFSPKSLIFYGCAIGSVTLLFSLASAYGEANLKAPDKIDGRYPLSTSSLPDCVQAQSLVIDVQQSGVYLTGSLLPNPASEKILQMAHDRPSLTGDWDNQQLTLGGSVPYLPNCQGTVSIQGMINKDTLTGTFRLSSDASEVPFFAKREAPPAKTQAH
ncbi:hypothetical protein JOY44_09350 [Phormidium sp. CLA17]|uniref:hypothetical protein n=1 Tax=Leptolyngbya sp. Cla-17 TaxID=2803751 RepID=UPI0014913307|nr:hypothetical protein [Leptolyngbya sp. Cla-17]MBM0741824.1 hypothetical protein [Leptolyngbya sp. Cla-17]